jgi:hypothetical protein
MSLLARRLLAVHDGLSAAALPHAFGGAIALAYCTEEPRGTRDLDVNVFIDPTRAKDVFAALPSSVIVADSDVEAAEQEGQARVWWEDTPIDVFLDIHSFHEEVARGVRQVPFMDRTIPVLGCTGLAVFKALFDRTKDWADIEAMVEVGAMDVPDAVAWLTRMVSSEHPAAQRMVALRG